MTNVADYSMCHLYKIAFLVLTLISNCFNVKTTTEHEVDDILRRNTGRSVKASYNAKVMLKMTGKNKDVGLNFGETTKCGANEAITNRQTDRELIAI